MIDNEKIGSSLNEFKQITDKYSMDEFLNCLINCITYYRKNRDEKSLSHIGYYVAILYERHGLIDMNTIISHATIIKQQLEIHETFKQIPKS